MKKTILKLIPILILTILIANSFKSKDDKSACLNRVLKNLEQIQSAKYFITSEAYVPGSSSPAYINNSMFKEYDNPKDSTIGASYVSFCREDTTQMTFCYDGKMRVLVYEDENKLVVDSFKINRAPFRLVSPPFFNYTKSIIKYALETQDSISTKIKDMGDSLYFSLLINEDKQVEFFGRASYVENQYTFGNNTSKYEIWIKKEDYLPYRVRREMAHSISVNTRHEYELNKLKIENFIASDYFQPDFEISFYGDMFKSRKKNKTSSLIGKIAPSWKLADTKGIITDLAEIKSKVLLIQFTGIGCGSCQASIPFMKGLVTEFKDQDFELISIETWQDQISTLQQYSEKNKMNYSFFNGTKKVEENYQIKAVPVFFILDEERKIIKVIKGYQKGVIDNEIRAAINELI
ncbi:TlpA family protein disulfide reductase [Ancylomarina sp. YFZ004]